MDYDTFRHMFGLARKSIEQIRKYELTLQTASAMPHTLNSGYEFLSDPEIGRDEKIRRLKPVYENANARNHNVLDTIFDRDAVLEGNHDDISSICAERLAAELRQASLLIEEGKRNRLDVDAEKRELSEMYFNFIGASATAVVYVSTGKISPNESRLDAGETIH